MLHLFSSTSVVKCNYIGQTKAIFSSINLISNITQSLSLNPIPSWTVPSVNAYGGNLYLAVYLQVTPTVPPTESNGTKYSAFSPDQINMLQPGAGRGTNSPPSLTRLSRLGSMGSRPFRHSDHTFQDTFVKSQFFLCLFKLLNDRRWYKLYICVYP